jgi:peptidylprolyl isomerase
MNQAKLGDTVKVHYEAKLSDGKVFDTSFKRDPLEITLGKGQVIPGLEQAIVGMQPGETKMAFITADKAFGPHLEDKVVRVDRKQVPDNLEVKPGQQLKGHQADGTPYFVKVKDVSESSVTIDANHPLAGQDLAFDIKLVEIA